MFKLFSYTKLFYFFIQERVGLSESSSFSSVDCEVKERRAVSDSVHMDVSRKLTKHNSQSTSSVSSPAKDKSRKSEWYCKITSLQAYILFARKSAAALIKF